MVEVKRHDVRPLRQHLKRDVRAQGHDQNT
jgi:hypothetical protein